MFWVTKNIPLPFHVLHNGWVFNNCVGALLICVLVFNVFCIVCTVFFVLFLLCIFYSCLFVYTSVRTTATE